MGIDKAGRLGSIYWVLPLAGVPLLTGLAANLFNAYIGQVELELRREHQPHARVSRIG